MLNDYDSRFSPLGTDNHKTETLPASSQWFRVYFREREDVLTQRFNLYQDRRACVFQWGVILCITNRVILVDCCFTQYRHVVISSTNQKWVGVSALLWRPVCRLKVTPLQEDVLRVSREPLRDAVLVKNTLTQVLSYFFSLTRPAAAFPENIKVWWKTDTKKESKT